MSTTTKTASNASAPIMGIGIDCDDIHDVAARIRAKHATLADAENYAGTSDCRWTFEEVCTVLMQVVGGPGVAAICKAMQKNAITAAVKAAKPTRVNALTVKVGMSGTVAVYGLNRFPVAVYANQWRKLAMELLGVDPATFEQSAIGQFIASNPVEIFPIAKWQAKDKATGVMHDTPESLAIKQGQVHHATYDAASGTVAVSLAEDKA